MGVYILLFQLAIHLNHHEVLHRSCCLSSVSMLAAEKLCVLNAKSPEDCQRLCRLEQLCEYFTWVENDGRCYLKTAKYSRQAECPHCVSGHVFEGMTEQDIGLASFMYPDIDLWGGDIDCADNHVHEA